VTTVLAVDGGQSGIRLKTSTGPRTVEVEGVSRLEGDTIEAVARAIGSAWTTGAFGPVDRAVLGLTTAPLDAEASDRLAALVSEATGAREIWIADDSVTSHAGALTAEAGVSLICGTGVGCLAVAPDGRSRTIDGHGYLLGDAGGGFWIGSRGVSAVLRNLEGRGAQTALTEHAEVLLGGLDDLPLRLHTMRRPVNHIAQFARAVLDASDAGDAVASAIVDDAARELFDTASVGIRWVGKDAPLALGGRLLGTTTPLFARLVEHLGSSGMSFRPADASGLDGALLLGEGEADELYRGLIHVWKEGTAL